MTHPPLAETSDYYRQRAEAKLPDNLRSKPLSVLRAHRDTTRAIVTDPRASQERRDRAAQRLADIEREMARRSAGG